jgi:NAD(P)-dependent dehydrogenase (short-subunit alcohol dehydrogenase family)
VHYVAYIRKRSANRQSKKEFLMYDLSTKTVLVTGASKGIGAAIARQCGDAGAAVVAHYGTDLAGAEAATADIPGSRKKLVTADFNDLDSVEALWDAAENWRGGIDVLINNAAAMSWNGGIEEPLHVWDTVWDETLRINVLAPARLLRRALLHFLTRSKGTVITISSWAAQRGVTNPATIAYGASKAAIHNATKTVARAYADRGILAYAIAPGVVRTRLSEQFATTQGGEERITNSLAMKEWVPPEEIAATAVFLASGQARHLSGATLDINGASYIR